MKKLFKVLAAVLMAGVLSGVAGCKTEDESAESAWSNDLVEIRAEQLSVQITRTITLACSLLAVL